MKVYQHLLGGQTLAPIGDNDKDMHGLYVTFVCRHHQRRTARGWAKLKGKSSNFQHENIKTWLFRCKAKGLNRSNPSLMADLILYFRSD